MPYRLAQGHRLGRTGVSSGRHGIITERTACINPKVLVRLDSCGGPCLSACAFYFPYAFDLTDFFNQFLE